MKHMKITALCLCALMLFSSVAIIAAEELTELVTGGGFETVKEDGTPEGWYLGTGEWGTDFSFEYDRPYDGEKALKINTTKSSVLAAFGTNKITGGTRALVSYYVNAVELQGRGLTTQLVFYSDADAATGSELAEYGQEIAVTEIRTGRYVEQKYEVDIPEEAKYMTVRIRLYGGGEVYLDSASLRGKYNYGVLEGETDETEAPAQDETPFLPPMEGESEMLRNLSFEELDEEGELPGWACNTNGGKLKGNTVVTRITDDVHSGQYAIKISGSGNPFITAPGLVVEPGHLYQVSIWAKMINRGGQGLAFKIEGYSDPVRQDGTTADENNLSFDTEPMAPVTGDWQQFVTTFRPNPGTASIKLYPRLYGGGTILLDDASCYKIGGPALYDELISENRIFYTDNREGMSSSWVDLFIENDPTLMDCTADFTLTTPNGSPAAEIKDVKPDEKGRVTFAYPAYSFSAKDKQKAYIVSVKVKRPDGTVIMEDQNDIYVYDRPSRLSADGQYMMNDMPFSPVIAYHPDFHKFAEYKKAGINVVSMSEWWFEDGVKSERTDALFAALEEHDLYAIICLYAGHVPAAHPNNEDFVRSIIAEYKNHPRIFAWKTQDEPYIVLDLPNVEDLMVDSYRLVRDIDPDVPVLIVDSQESAEKFKAPARATDILLVDVYPGAEVAGPTAERVENANIATDYDKTVYLLDQTFNYRNYTTNAQDIRHFAYQAYMAGAKGYGHYAVDEVAYKDTEGNAVVLHESTEGPTVAKLHLEEVPMLYEHFVAKETPLFNEEKTDSYWYRSWVKNDKIYMAVLSMDNEDIQTVEIPLTSITGQTVSHFAARVAYGGNVAAIVKKDGVLPYTLSAKQAVLFEITPMDEVDFSELYNPRFDDLEEYPWARNQIEALQSEGIIAGISENGYRPGKEISRVEFAAYLVRALGLTTTISTSFKDIDSTSRYAGDIAAGKLGGILQGVDAFNFNPNGLLTREDMMVMTARALQLSGSGNLSAFPDGGETSDYAVDAVSAMVEEGFIEGDELGNLNPKGNTTRAEAAVYLYRIWESGEFNRA